MSAIRFLSENYVDFAQFSMLEGTENAQFKLSNLKNESPSIKFRGEGNKIRVLIDLLQVRPIDTVAVVGDPLGNMGFTSASIKTSVTTDFSASTKIDITISPEQNIAYVFFTATNDRYVELTLENSGTFCELGYIFLGEKIELTNQNISIDSFRYGYRDNSNLEINKYGQKFIERRNQTKFLTGQLLYCTKDEHKTLDDLFIYHSRNRPLWMIADSDGNAMTDGEYKLTIYGYLFRHPRWSAAGGQLYSTNIRLDEAV